MSNIDVVNSSLLFFLFLFKLIFLVNDGVVLWYCSWPTKTCCISVRPTNEAYKRQRQMRPPPLKLKLFLLFLVISNKVRKVFGIWDVGTVSKDWHLRSWNSFTEFYVNNYRSSNTEVFCKKIVLKNLTTFSGKH